MALLVMDAILFYALGAGIKGGELLMRLREQGWTVEPPDIRQGLSGEEGDLP